MDIILKADNVTKRYASKTALDQVTVEIPKGSIFGLLGPNGAGKTSLIRIINQITAPDQGSILLDGQVLNPSHIKDIGYLPEERGLYKKMKVGEQALYLAKLKGMHHRDAVKALKEWFTRFEIIDWWDKKIEELSKGMQQKIQFIVTVVHQPKLLILDEPFSGFDPINTDLIKREILHLRDQGATIIFSTHNMESVEEICDHIALINRSKKILEGSVKAVKEQFKANLFEVVFKGNRMGFANALGSRFELKDIEENGELMVAKVRILNNHTPNDLLGSLLPFVSIQAFREIIPSMNEVFIQKVTEINELGSDWETSTGNNLQSQTHE